MTLGGDAMRRVSTSGEWRQDGGRGEDGEGEERGGDGWECSHRRGLEQDEVEEVSGERSKLGFT